MTFDATCRNKLKLNTITLDPLPWSGNYLAKIPIELDAEIEETDMAIQWYAKGTFDPAETLVGTESAVTIDPVNYNSVRASVTYPSSSNLLNPGAKDNDLSSWQANDLKKVGLFDFGGNPHFQIYKGGSLSQEVSLDCLDIPEVNFGWLSANLEAKVKSGPSNLDPVLKIQFLDDAGVVINEMYKIFYVPGSNPEKVQLFAKNKKIPDNTASIKVMMMTDEDLSAQDSGAVIFDDLRLIIEPDFFDFYSDVFSTPSYIGDVLENSRNEKILRVDKSVRYHETSRL